MKTCGGYGKEKFAERYVRREASELDNAFGGALMEVRGSDSDVFWSRRPSNQSSSTDATSGSEGASMTKETWPIFRSAQKVRAGCIQEWESV